MKEKLFEIFRTVFELEYVDENLSQNSCDKWDSLKHLNLIVELENEFEVEFEPEDIAEMKNFKAIMQILEKK